MRSPRHCSGCAKAPPPPTSFSTARATSGSRRSAAGLPVPSPSPNANPIMSKRRELQEHSDSLADIGELLGAMKNLALVEPSHRHLHRRPTRRRPHRRGPSQSSSPTTPNTSCRLKPAARCCASSARNTAERRPQPTFIGSPRKRSSPPHAASATHHGPRVVLVGSRAPRLGGDAAAAMAGAGFADEVQNILADLVATPHAPVDARQPGAQSPLPDRRRPGHSEPAPRARARQGPRNAPQPSRCAEINLPPRQLHAAP